ncbi:MAG: hypothetical protein JWN11_295, partial [Hyphomicrobiales bacterium]|nr:hypothetical protein [Hyphomicrobiales bacterium]
MKPVHRRAVLGLIAAASMSRSSILRAGGDRALPLAKFPLRVSADKRHIEDSNGRPFLINGDSAWSLIADLNRDDA